MVRVNDNEQTVGSTEGSVELSMLGQWETDRDDVIDDNNNGAIVKNLRIMSKLGDFTVHPVLDQF